MKNNDPDTIPQENENPQYEPPVVVDLNTIQRGEGIIACAPGSAAFPGCNAGSQVPPSN